MDISEFAAEIFDLPLSHSYDKFIGELLCSGVGYWESIACCCMSNSM